MKVRIIISLAVALNLGVAGILSAQQKHVRARHATEPGIAVPEDTLFRLKLNTALNSKTSRVGDPISATVTAPVVIENQVVVPEGSTVQGKVTSVHPAERRKNGTIAVGFTRLQLANGTSRTITGSLASLTDQGGEQKTDQEGRVTGKSTTKRTVVFIGGGAGVGAAIGAAAGGGKGAGIGAAIGAGIGTAGALLSKGHEAEVASGTEIGMRLDRGVSLPVASR